MASAAEIRSILHAQAERLGLTLRWAVPRDAIDPCFARASGTQLHDGVTPAAVLPGYRSALVLASAGPAFWRTFRAQWADASPPNPADDPLDRYTEQVLEALCALLRSADAAATPVYPFRHARQVLGFTRLLGAQAPWLGRAPFGLLVHPQAGPWWALRGALLSTLPAEDLGAPPEDTASPCEACPAPCVAACPAGAVYKAGFDWRACADFRLGEPTCHETCLARLACPVAPALRYDGEAIAFHYRASLRQLERMPRGAS